MMQGRRQALSPKVDRTDVLRSRDDAINNDIATSIKSLSSGQTKNELLGSAADRDIVKIEGGGERGQDKVQLNVKFTHECVE